MDGTHLKSFFLEANPSDVFPVNAFNSGIARVILIFAQVLAILSNSAIIMRSI
jgi:hypothetical protein